MVYMFYVYEFLANLFNFDYDLFILEGISCGLERFDVESYRVINKLWMILEFLLY